MPADPPLYVPLFIQARRTPTGWRVEAGWSTTSPPKVDVDEPQESRIGRAIDRLARLAGHPTAADIALARPDIARATPIDVASRERP